MDDADFLVRVGAYRIAIVDHRSILQQIRAQIRQSLAQRSGSFRGIERFDFHVAKRGHAGSEAATAALLVAAYPEVDPHMQRQLMRHDFKGEVGKQGLGYDQRRASPIHAKRRLASVHDGRCDLGQQSGLFQGCQVTQHADDDMGAVVLKRCLGFRPQQTRRAWPFQVRPGKRRVHAQQGDLGGPDIEHERGIAFGEIRRRRKVFPVCGKEVANVIILKLHLFAEEHERYDD